MTQRQSGSLLLSLCGSFIHDTSPVCTGAPIGSYALPRTPSSPPSELGSPPQHLLPSSAPLAYPVGSDHAALPMRPERHHPASITTMRVHQARTLVALLPGCPYCGTNDGASAFMTQ